MKYTIIKISFLLVIGFIFTTQVNAQLCGQYGVTLNVKTIDEKSIENASVQLLPLEKDEIRGKTFVRDEENLAKFKIVFLEGHVIKTKYKLLVSADGFETFEQDIKFPHCKRQNFDIKLKISKNSASSVLSGTVYDANGSLITQAKITATNEKGEKFETQTNEDGTYNLNLPYNPYVAGDSKYKVSKYEIIVEKSGFEKGIIKDFKFVPAFNNGKMNLDFALDVFVNIDTIDIPSDKFTSIKGKVIDKHGAFIPSASIIFKDKKYNSYKTKSNEQGDYEIKLPLGEYKIIAEYGSSDKCRLINIEKELEVSRNEINRHDITMILKYDNESECVSH